MAYRPYPPPFEAVPNAGGKGKGKGYGMQRPSGQIPQDSWSNQELLSSQNTAPAPTQHPPLPNDQYHYQRRHAEPDEHRLIEPCLQQQKGKGKGKGKNQGQDQSQSLQQAPSLHQVQQQNGLMAGLVKLLTRVTEHLPGASPDKRPLLNNSATDHLQHPVQPAPAWSPLPPTQGFQERATAHLQSPDQDSPPQVHYSGGTAASAGTWHPYPQIQGPQDRATAQLVHSAMDAPNSAQFGAGRPPQLWCPNLHSQDPHLRTTVHTESPVQDALPPVQLTGGLQAVGRSDSWQSVPPKQDLQERATAHPVGPAQDTPHHAYFGIPAGSFVAHHMPSQDMPIGATPPPQSPQQEATAPTVDPDKDSPAGWRHAEAPGTPRNMALTVRQPSGPSISFQDQSCMPTGNNTGPVSDRHPMLMVKDDYGENMFQRLVAEVAKTCLSLRNRQTPLDLHNPLLTCSPLRKCRIQPLVFLHILSLSKPTECW